MLPALAVLEAAAAAPGTGPPAPAPQAARKAAARKGALPALRQAEDTAAPLEPAQAAGPAGAPQARVGLAGHLSPKTLTALPELGRQEVVCAAAGVYEALVAPRLGCADGAVAHAAPRVLWQQRAFAGAVQPLLQVWSAIWQGCEGPWQCHRPWTHHGSMVSRSDSCTVQQSGPFLGRTLPRCQPGLAGTTSRRSSDSAATGCESRTLRSLLAPRGMLVALGDILPSVTTL